MRAAPQMAARHGELTTSYTRGGAGEELGRELLLLARNEELYPARHGVPTIYGSLPGMGVLIGPSLFGRARHGELALYGYLARHGAPIG